MGTNHYYSVSFTREVNGEDVTYNSFDDWGLYLEEPVTVSPPEPNTYMVEVPGRNGSLDLTESAIGTVTYQDREIEFPFLSRERRPKWNQLYQTVINCVHGRYCKITCSDDPEYYYEGRVTVDAFKPGDNMVRPTLHAVVRPFKTKNTVDSYSATLSAESETTVRLGGIRNNMYNVVTGSGDSKRTTILFGSKNVRSVDWDAYKALTVEYDKSGRKTSIAVYSGDTGAGTMEQTTGTHYSWTLKKESSVISWSGIYKIVITGDVSNVKVSGTLQANTTITVPGSAKPVVPDIDTDTAVTMTVNGQKYDVAAGSYYNENVVIRDDPVTFAFYAKSTISGGETVTVRYRRGLL